MVEGQKEVKIVARYVYSYNSLHSPFSIIKSEYIFLNLPQSGGNPLKEVLQKIYLGPLAVLCCALISCSTSFNINPTSKEFENPPQINRINARIGISIPQQVRSYISSDDLMKVAFGESGSSRFAEAASWMFSDTIQVSEKKTWKEIKTPPDGFLELKSLRLEREDRRDLYFPFEIRVEYKICFYNSNGEEINCWVTNQNIPHRGLESPNIESELVPSIEKAVRGAIAKFIVAFGKDLHVQKWAANISGLPSDKGNERVASINPKDKKHVGLFLIWRGLEVTAPPLEEKYEKYIKKGMLQECPTNNIIHSQRIRDILYPFMEPETAPETEGELLELIYQEDIKNRLINNDIRYLAVVYGRTVQGDEGGYFLCGYGAAPAAGCLGFAWANEETSLAVIIFDLLKFKMDGRLELTAEDTQWAIGLGLPLWHSAQSEKKGCAELGTVIGKYLREKNNFICKE